MLARVPVRAKENDTIAEVLYADSDNNTGMLTVGDYYSILMVFIIRTMVEGYTTHITRITLKRKMQSTHGGAYIKGDDSLCQRRPSRLEYWPKAKTQAIRRNPSTVRRNDVDCV